MSLMLSQNQNTVVKKEPIVVLLAKLEPCLTILFLAFYANLSILGPYMTLISAFSYIAIPILIAFNFKRFAYVITREPLLLAIIILAIASVTWSVTPDATQINARSLIRTSLFGAYIATRYDSKEQLNLILLFFGITALLSVFYSLAIPEIGIFRSNGPPVWRGIFKHKNHLAINMALSSTLFLIATIYKRHFLRLGLIGFGLSLAALIFSDGKSALSIFVVATALIPVYKILLQHYKIRVVFLLTLGLLIGTVAVAVFTNLEFIVVDLLGKDLGGNGRDELWLYLLERASERPLLGYGYSGFWFNPVEVAGVSTNTWLQTGVGNGHAHSGFIDLLLHLGWVGSILFFINFVHILFKTLITLSLTQSVEAFSVFLFLIIMFISNFSVNASFLAPRHLFWVLYVSMTLSSAIELTRATRNRALRSQPASIKTDEMQPLR